MSSAKTLNARRLRRINRQKSATNDLPEFHLWVLHQSRSERWKLLLRLPAFLILGLLQRIWGLFAALVAILQWVHILVLGTRSPRLSEWYLQWFSFSSSLSLYVGGVTDDIPSLFVCPFKYDLEQEAAAKSI